MNGILAVVEPSETDMELLEEAAAVADAADVEVIVLSLVVDGRDAESVEAMRRWMGTDSSGEGVEEMTDTAARFAEEAARDALGSRGVAYTAVGDYVDDTRPSAKVVSVAENHGCDHVYVANRSRSPAGKALFGEMAQSIVLNFDGFVTVRTAK